MSGLKSTALKGGLVVLLAALLAGVSSDITYANESKAKPIRILVNEQAVIFADAKPFYDTNGRVQVPLRFVSERLGATVQWDGATKTVTVVIGGDVIELGIGARTYSLNGEQFPMDTAAVMLNGATFIPVRYIAQALGVNMSFDPSLNTIHMNTAGSEPTTEPVSINTAGKADYNGFMIAAERDSRLLVGKGIYDLYGSEYTLLNMVVVFDNTDKDRDYRKQYKEVEEILLQKLDPATVAAVMSYLHTKTTAKDVLPSRDFEDDNYMITVSSRVGDDNINIFVFKQ